MEPALALRDIHIPEHVSSWPPSIIWLVILVLVTSLAAGVIWFGYLRPKQLRAYRQALKRIHELMQQPDSSINKVAAINKILKQYVKHCCPHQAILASNEPWLNFLAEHAPHQIWSPALAKLIQVQQFEPESSEHAEQLQAWHHFACQWLHHHRDGRRLKHVG